MIDSGLLLILNFSIEVSACSNYDDDRVNGVKIFACSNHERPVADLIDHARRTIGIPIMLVSPVCWCIIYKMIKITHHL